jgi:uncharacterized protein YbjT (DUF2867 family)
MKIVVTGSLGHISKPLTEQLIASGHHVTVVTRSKKAEIESLGATPAVGSIEDVDFLSQIFKGADAVYVMIPPTDYSNPSLDFGVRYASLGRGYAAAIKAAGVKRVVNLSTFGADLDKGNGILIGAHYVEEILNELPADITAIHMRPCSFYYNLLAYVDTIRHAGFIAANYGEDDIVPWVAPEDIADAVAEELQSSKTGRLIRYVASEEITCNAAARIIGEAIGKPDLQWKRISDEEALGYLKAAGIAPRVAEGMTEMFGAIHTGLLASDFNRHKPVFGKVKMKDYAKQFAAIYNQSSSYL